VLGKHNREVCFALIASSTAEEGKMQRQRLLDVLQQLAPLELAEEWDNVGLLVAPTVERDIERVLLTIDLTSEVLDEARSFDAQLIVAYHPPVFSGLKRITADDRTGSIVVGCLESGMSVYSPHTALDATTGGVNDWLASAFSHRTIRAIEPKSASNGYPDDTILGQGRIVELERGIGSKEAIERVKTHLGLTRVRHAAASTRVIRRVAVCPGAGGSVLDRVPADLYLTGEMRHHDVLAATARGTHVVLTDHTNTERGYLPQFARRIQNEVSGVEVRISKNDSDPLKIV
jgi:dinuclear metal center YbgI/SA1388 family protein